MSAITSEKIRIEAAVPIEKLQELHMELQKDSHAVIRLTGMIDGQDGENALLKPVNKTALKVWISDTLLFSGILKSIQIVQEGQVYQAYIEGISSTAYLDYERRSRTFQNTGTGYKEIMNEVLGNMIASLHFNTDDHRIDAPLYQLEETDWEFTRRLASHLNMSLYPSILSEKPEVSVGIPAGRIYSREEIQVFKEKIYSDGKNGNVSIDISTYENLEIGDRVRWKGISYSVTGKSCLLDKGLLCFRYRLLKEEDLEVKRYENPNAIGRLLPARVLAVKDERVKVKFDIDKTQDIEAAYWYPWEPEAGNIMYCMPEVGEQIYVRLGDYFGKQSAAVYGVHENGQGNPEMKVTDRYFTTVDKKRMYLLPECLGFRDLRQTSPLEISLKDDSGAEVISNRQIVISAKETIGIKGNHIFFQAPKEVSLVRRDSVAPTIINMCNGFDSIGATNEVTMTGEGGEGFPAFHDYRQEENSDFNLGGTERCILASTPGRRLKRDIEKQVGGLQVNYLGEEDDDNQLQAGRTEV